MVLVLSLTSVIVRRMELVQIGRPATVTFQQLIEQMAAQQCAEIEQLRQDALARQSARTGRRATTSRTKLYRRFTGRISAGDSATARSRSASL